MVAKLTPDLVEELAQAGDQPLPVEDPRTKRVYLLVDAERFDVIRRSPVSSAGHESWTESKNERRRLLIRKKFTQGISAEEDRELTDLQAELSAYRRQAVPLPYDAVDALGDALNAAPI